MAANDPNSRSPWPHASLMHRLSRPARAALTERGRAYTVRAGHRVLVQGEGSDHALVLLTGVVKVVHYTPHGIEVMLAIRVGGDLVGEMSALEGAPRSATVIACVPTKVLRIDGATFRRFLAEHPSAALEVARMVSSRLRWANDRRADMTAHTAETRIARVLMEIHRAYGWSTRSKWELGVDLTQSELASLAGVALTTTEKTLRRLDRAGIVRRAYRNVVITDLEGLRNVARMTAQNPY
jgi:CRP/FNR family cyclic AMP-dependent transcriptional regulator